MKVKILDLKEAANYLNMSPQTLQRKAAQGIIPGGKPGRCWCFREDDLADYLRTLYSKTAKASWGDHQRRNQWHSTNEKTCGGLTSATMEQEYSAQLGLQTK